MFELWQSKAIRMKAIQWNGFNDLEVASLVGSKDTDILPPDPDFGEDIPLLSVHDDERQWDYELRVWDWLVLLEDNRVRVWINEDFRKHNERVH